MQRSLPALIPAAIGADARSYSRADIHTDARPDGTTDDHTNLAAVRGRHRRPNLGADVESNFQRPHNRTDPLAHRSPHAAAVAAAVASADAAAFSHAAALQRHADASPLGRADAAPDSPSVAWSISGTDPLPYH